VHRRQTKPETGAGNRTGAGARSEGRTKIGGIYAGTFPPAIVFQALGDISWARLAKEIARRAPALSQRAQQA
jgi:hypothetical protein